MSLDIERSIQSGLEATKPLTDADWAAAWRAEVSRLRGMASICLALKPSPKAMRRTLEQIAGLPASIEK